MRALCRGWLRLLLPLLIPCATGTVAFQVCGQYCGPGWCSGKQIWEDDCTFTADADSCADTCCKAHDECCSHPAEATASCNQEIVACLVGCRDKPSCRIPNTTIPFPSEAVAIAMQVVSEWCCGAPCPSSSMASTIPFDFIPRTLEGLMETERKRNGDGLSWRTELHVRLLAYSLTAVAFFLLRF